MINSFQLCVDAAAESHLQLIRINHVKPDSPELQEILTRYATPSIKERLLSDLQRAV
ncbi:MAG: hypothetical protein WEB60_04890 [Terrimicrobiaceae bacterium]